MPQRLCSIIKYKKLKSNIKTAPKRIQKGGLKELTYSSAGGTSSV